MTGGTFEKAEEGTWLICAEEPEVTLTLGSGMEDLFRKKGGT